MINVTKSYLPNLHKYQSYVEEIFSSGYLTNHARFVRELEDQISTFLGVRNLILVANGTLALQIAYRLLELKGDVLTTPFSFVATTSSLVWERLNPVFVDIDEETLNINAAKIESKITEHTSAIVATHVYGNPCDIDGIEDIAKRHDLLTVYDAAHAFSVQYKGNSIMSFGDISIISFHSTKLFHTIEGGALVIRDDALYERAKRMINFGIIGPGQIADLGINAKMNEFQAAMGLCILEDIDDILNNRERVFQRYMEGFQGAETIRFPKQCPSGSRNFSHFPIIFKSEDVLLRVQHALNKDGVNPRRYFYPSLDTLSYVVQNQDVPVSRELAKRVLCLPIYDSLPDYVQGSIIQIVKDNL